jgi:hypothetical protein
MKLGGRMSVNWDEVQKALYPIKSFEDLAHRLQVSCSYSFVRDHYKFSMPELASYSQKLLGGDSRQRYAEYLARLTKTITQLDQAGVKDILALQEQTASRRLMEHFVEQCGLPATEITSVLKFLVYWIIPGEKYLSGLVRDDPYTSSATQLLARLGIRTNLQLLEKGLNPEGRKSLVKTSGLPIEVITDLVNRADFSRLPWASKATISNIIGAGYKSISQLAKANPQKLYEDFFRYGKSIGKNLKLGNEIENSYRIAKIVPVLLREE